jgi:tetratricopeptide (TPR) repeat protein
MRSHFFLLGACAAALPVWFLAYGCGSADESSENGVKPLHYLGAASCASCHPTQYQGWRSSDHDLAMQEVAPESVLGDFDNVKIEHYGRSARFFQQGEDFMVATEDGAGIRQNFKIEYVFGHDPLQQYLVAMPNGRLQVLPYCWDTRPRTDGGQRWFHIRPDEAIPPGDILHWTKPSQNWNFMCAECHSTRLSRNYDAAKGSFDTQWQELNVACESCHGPGSRHQAWAESVVSDGGQASLTATATQMGIVVDLRDPDPTGWSWNAQLRKPVRSGHPLEAKNSELLGPQPNHAEVEACAPCHSRRSPLGDDVPPGSKFLDAYQPSLLEADLYYPDGQIQAEVYVWGSFLQSKMFHAGVACSDCHDPHSLKPKLPGNALCTQCHSAAIYDVDTHHYHGGAGQLKGVGADSPAGTQCVDCHMPSTTYMVVDARRDHSFRVPRPDLSAELGAPNACNRCHTERDAAWAAEQIAQWRGPNAAPLPYHYGQAIQLGRRGAPGAAEALSKLILDEAQPEIVRATALSLLGVQALPGLVALAQMGLASESPLLRMGAARAAQNLDAQNRLQLLVPALSDPRKAVRMEAVRGMLPLMNSLGMGSAIESTFAGVLDEYRLANEASADRPASRMNLGLMYLQLGDQVTAEREYRAALQLDDHYVPAAVNLADLLRSLKRDAEGGRLLEATLRLEPGNADLLHALGLLQVRQGQTQSALISLQEAANAAPQNPRYAYVLGVALYSQSELSAALAAYQKGLQHNPWDINLLVTVANYFLEQNSPEQARVYAQKLLLVRPDLGVGQQILDSLGK